MLVVIAAAAALWLPIKQSCASVISPCLRSCGACLAWPVPVHRWALHSLGCSWDVGHGTSRSKGSPRWSVVLHMVDGVGEDGEEYDPSMPCEAWNRRIGRLEIGPAHRFSSVKRFSWFALRRTSEGRRRRTGFSCPFGVLGGSEDPTPSRFEAPPSSPDFNFDRRSGH